MEKTQEEWIDYFYDAMSAFGVKDQRDRAHDLIQQGQASATCPGSKLVADAGGALAKATKAWLKQQKRGEYTTRVHQMLESMGTERASAITVVFCLNFLSKASLKDCRVRKVRAALASRLNTEWEFMCMAEAAPQAMKWEQREIDKGGLSMAKARERLLRRLDSDSLDLWDKKDQFLLASLMLNLVMRETGLIVQENKKFNLGHKDRSSHKPITVFSLAPEVKDWFANSLQAIEQLRPARLPVPHKPLEWNPEGGGGYLPGRMPQLPFISGRVKSKPEQLRDYPEVVDAVNILQSTGWRINVPVVDAVREAAAKNWHDVGLLSPAPERPNKPNYDYKAGDDLWLAYGAANRRWNEQSHAEFLDRARLGRTLAVTKLLEPLDSFYYPYQLDFRGRAYSVGSHISPQGPDFQRGSLEFANGLPLGEDGFAHLLYQAANTHGEMSKGTLAERVAWGQQNLDELVKFGHNPKANQGWREADEPFQFLAACQELWKATWEGETFLSHLPVAFDGTSNGLQCLSLMLRDEVGGKATNCVPVDRPQDIYSAVGTEVMRKLKEIDANPQADARRRRMAKRLIDFCEKTLGEKIYPRAAMKRPTMIVPYSGGRYAVQKYLTDHYHEVIKSRQIPESQHPFPERDVYQIMSFLANITMEAMGSVVVKAFEVMDWLREVASIACDQNVHLSWSTPLGFIVNQKYVRGDRKVVKMRAGNDIRLTYYEDSDRIDRKRTKNGIVPNVIHSLDAAAMGLTAILCNDVGISDLSMVHDSFASHAGNATKLNVCLREAYKQVFSQDLLNLFAEQFSRQLEPGTELPPCPEIGNMDISKLTEAKYFFA